MITATDVRRAMQSLHDKDGDSEGSWERLEIDSESLETDVKFTAMVLEIVEQLQRQEATEVQLTMNLFLAGFITGVELQNVRAA